jgi:hypothetical protein
MASFFALKSFFFLLTPMTIFWCDNLNATYLFLPSIFLVVYLLNFTPNFIWSLHQLPEGVYYKKFYRNYRIISHICFYRISLCNTLYVVHNPAHINTRGGLLSLLFKLPNIFRNLISYNL